MKVDRGTLDRLARFKHAVACWIDDDGYPLQVAVTFSVEPGAGVVRLTGTGVEIPDDREVNLIASHIRPKPGEGYDERRYVSLWGRVTSGGRDVEFRPHRAWRWDEADVPFFEYAERSNSQARRYLRSLSDARGTEVRPRLSRFWTALISMRLPFLTATIVPVLLGIAVAARHDAIDWWLAVLTLVGACAVHIGLNTANDVFDALSGADEANINPTQFSGGSRVIQRGILSLKQMSTISLSAYAVGIGIGLYLVISQASVELLAIGAAGLLISVFYTAPPLRLVHRGLGEVATAAGFGPIMLLGAYVVQTGSISLEASVISIPVALLIALVLYVNEIPDRRSDASVGKRTLPVRLSRDAVTTLFLLAAGGAFMAIVVAVVTGLAPAPALLALAGAPLAWQVYAGIRQWYDDPYALMPVMGRNVQLHALTGTLLLAGYLVAIVVDAAFDGAPGLLT
jgi:1,4-dihydroxy-2-naphthoate octaprenyltransferase